MVAMYYRLASRQGRQWYENWVRAIKKIQYPAVLDIIRVIFLCAWYWWFGILVAPATFKQGKKYYCTVYNKLYSYNKVHLINMIMAQR